MKRVFPLLLVLLGCLVFAGCPGGEEGDGADATTTTDGGSPSTDGGGGGGNFAAGVDSGRAEDGSDEEK